jgi:hypothetical protein
MRSTDRKIELQANDIGLNRLGDVCVIKRLGEPGRARDVRVFQWVNAETHYLNRERE